MDSVSGHAHSHTLELQIMIASKIIIVLTEMALLKQHREKKNRGKSSVPVSFKDVEAANV